MLLALATALPSLFWQGPPDTAAALRAANIRDISVPASSAGEWRKLGFNVIAPPPADCIRLQAPKVNYRPNVARATSAPWVDENAWRYLRNPNAAYCVEAQGNAAALATAEAWTWGANAFIVADEAGARAWSDITAFLKSLPEVNLPPRVNVGFIDDGSPVTGEVMNLLVRRNILFRVIAAPDSALDLNVKPSWNEGPNAGNPDPSRAAFAIRQQLGDDRRLLRIYGSEVVIGRVFGNRDRARLVVLNYGARPVEAPRVRLLGRFTGIDLHAHGVPAAAARDIATDANATEFTIPLLQDCAVVDLRR